MKRRIKSDCCFCCPNSERLWVLECLNPFEPSVYFMHSTVQRSKNLDYLSVLWEFQNKPRLCPYTALTNWIFIRETGSVYCAVRTGTYDIKFKLVLVLRGLITKYSFIPTLCNSLPKHSFPRKVWLSHFVQTRYVDCCGAVWSAQSLRNFPNNVLSPVFMNDFVERNGQNSVCFLAYSLAFYYSVTVLHDRLLLVNFVTQIFVLLISFIFVSYH
jgi:hypothetical protein